MRVTRKVGLQLVVFVTVAAVSMAVIATKYIRLPSMAGIGRYEVVVHLPEAAGLYPRANVTYRGTEIGSVRDVSLTDSGVQAVLSLQDGVDVSSDVIAEVHSRTAVGEQYVALDPQGGDAEPLHDGSIIPESRTTVPAPVDRLLDATNKGLQAIPQDNLRTVIDESYTAVAGLGPDLARLVKGSTELASGARQHLDDLVNVIDNVGPLLDTQTNTSDSIQTWAANVANLSQQLQQRNSDVSGVIAHAPEAFAEGQRLIERLDATLPVFLHSLASVAPVLLTYNPSVEQLLVLLPRSVEYSQGALLNDKDIRSIYRGLNMNFNLVFNTPPPCSTGFLPPQQMRSQSLQDYPDRPPGDLYCRVPQDSVIDVRGARNIPCITRPGKRAPTVKMCESDEQYVPLNDGFNWKGDPNATLSGQGIPQLPPNDGSPTDSLPVAGIPNPQPPLAVAEYDPATGQYVGPDGKLYTQQSVLAPATQGDWRSLLLPPN